MTTIQAIFQTYAPAYLAQHGHAIPAHHRKVIQAISSCRTERQGVTVYTCEGCGTIQRVPRSCGNRHCPTCQHAKTQDWLQEHLRTQLPCAHFLVTFTVPQALRSVLRQHAQAGLNALFAASSATLKAFMADERYTGAELPGFFGVLHTWGRQMHYHPHIHYVVVGGGLSRDRARWMPSRVKFLAPVHALARAFRSRLRTALKEAGLHKEIPAAVWREPFVVNSQAVGCAANTLRYLAAYVFRVAISNHRIVKVEQGRVFFRYQKSGTREQRVMNLTAAEFLRRYLQHVLPKGFVKVRYYGFYAPAAKVEWDRLRASIQLAGDALLGPEDEQALQAPEDATHRVVACRRCGGTLVYVDTLIPRGGRLVSVQTLGRRDAVDSASRPGG